MMWWLVRLRLSFSPQTEDIASHLKIWLGHEVVKASSFVVVFGARVLLLCVSGEYTWTMSFSHSSQKLSAPAFPHLSIHDSRVYARIEDVSWFPIVATFGAHIILSYHYFYLSSPHTPQTLVESLDWTFPQYAFDHFEKDIQDQAIRLSSCGWEVIFTTRSLCQFRTCWSNKSKSE